MQLIWAIIIGFFVGLIARALMPGKDEAGFLITTMLGVVGALLATLLGQALGWYEAGEPAGFISSVLGAMILLGVFRGLTRRTARSYS
ncbi:MAG: GlsB/YeaQ/YmgE family stress response membrane protein [Deltaproteobacteria bacterium]|nr:GlsB/YeaQ/YmgE family stress response membrane protein [Deltaproteobacteria bacterium]